MSSYAARNEALFAALRMGDAAAREEIAGLNMGLVRTLAARLSAATGAEFEELCGAGNLGLCKAIDAYDGERGTAFSTYAVPVIAGEMKRFLRDTGPIKISRELKERALKIRRAEREMNSEGQSPTLCGIAARLGLSPEQVSEAYDAARLPLSLESEDAEGERYERFGREDPGMAVERLNVRQAIGELAAEDAALLRLRYFAGLTQSKTAQALGVTQVQVSRREKKILLLLREKLS